MPGQSLRTGTPQAWTADDHDIDTRVVHLVDAVPRQGAVVLQLLIDEEQMLLTWGDACLHLDLGLDILESDGVAGFHPHIASATHAAATNPKQKSHGGNRPPPGSLEQLHSNGWSSSQFHSE